MANYIYVPVARGTKDGFLQNPAVGWKDYKARYLNEKLDDVGDDDKLYIVGHGTLAGTSLQTLSADVLLRYLLNEGLPRTHKRFNLFSCYSGVRMPKAGKSFAEAFAHAIRDTYRSATVIGYIGAVQFDRAGGHKTVSTISAWSGAGDDLEGLMRAKGASVSFSVRRKWIGSNEVVANQSDSYAAAVREEEEEVVSVFGNGTINRTRVVVLDSAAAGGRTRAGAFA